MKDFIKKSLRSLLENLDGLFEENELAYLSSHCKNELQIRDRIAWQLHKSIMDKYEDVYVVRREWAPKEKEKSRVDLAILRMDKDKTKVEEVFALIEFKAHAIARPERSFYCFEFKKDVEKMLDWKQGENKVPSCQDADLYFVFLETGQSKEAGAYESILAYSLYQKQNKKCVYCNGAQDQKYLDAIKSHWAEFNQGKYVVKGIQSFEIPEPKAICIGETYGYKQYVSPLLIEIKS